MAARRHGRPRRGPAGPNVLVSGDTGPRQPQHGAGPPASESGNLQAREFGVPQADIPGGLKHLVNPQTHPSPTIDKPPRPADYHKEHGVPPDDWGDYETPPDESEHRAAERPAPEPAWREDAVPVVVVQEPGGKVRRAAVCTNINVPVAGSDPARVCGRDEHRVKVRVLNEDSTIDIRVAEKRSDLAFDPAQGAGAGGGALIWHGTNSYTDIETQEELFAITTSATATARLSVILITEVGA